jgi:hypothetical protein
MVYAPVEKAKKLLLFLLYPFLLCGLGGTSYNIVCGIVKRKADHRGNK